MELFNASLSGWIGFCKKASSLELRCNSPRRPNAAKPTKGKKRFRRKERKGRKKKESGFVGAGLKPALLATQTSLTTNRPYCTVNRTEKELSMKQLSLTQARAKLSTLVSEVDKGKGPVAIAQRSKVKAVLVDAEWHSRVEEELAHYRRAAKQSPLKLRGSMKVVGNVDRALTELRQERENSLERLVSGLK